nr:uncharacterized protein LOC128698429 [Cherax quadricarinatus]
MKVMIMVFLVFMVSGETIEDLPDPQEWKQGPSRTQFGPRPASVGLGAQESSSYDLTQAYNSLAANRMGSTLFSSNTGSNSNSNSNSNSKISPGGYADAGSSASNYYGSSDYGSYGSESGYGLSCSSGYVNASAVALLAFLFLLNIVQDVVQQITAGRRKREAEDEAKNEVFDFVYNGGLSALKEDLPQIVLPLMVDLMEASEVPSCMERPLCEANKALSIRHGVVGRVLASLISNVVGKAFTGDDHSKFRQVLEAASDGRSRHDCTVRSPGCFGRTSSPLGNNQRDD